MALQLTEASSDRITIPASSSTAQLMPVSFLFWLYCTSYHTSNVHILTKGPNTTFAREITLRTTGQIDCFFRTSATGPTARSANSAGNRMPLGAWTLLAITVSAGLVPRIYLGSLSASAAEVSYQTQTTGSGTPYDDSGLDGHFGNYEPGYSTAPDIAFAVMGIFNRDLSLAEIVKWQRRPQALSGCAGLWIPRVTASVQDFSGNGNHGTVTGMSAIASHVHTAVEEDLAMYRRIQPLLRR